MNALHTSMGGAQALPLDLLLAAIPGLPRAALNQLVDRAIEQMDGYDGDADLELNGDELEEGNAEDSFAFAYGHQRGGIWAGPGCPIADNDSGVDDGREWTDEREPENYDGGHPDIPPDHHRFHLTA